MSPPPQEDMVADQATKQFSPRLMRMDDLETVMAIERNSFKHPWSEELFKRELKHDWSVFLVAQSGERLVGFIVYWLVHDEIHILNIATDPAFRRQGVARTLIEECMAQGRRKGVALITLEVRRSNAIAISLYESFGFYRAGIRPKYYSDDQEDAVLMNLNLNS